MPVSLLDGETGKKVIKLGNIACWLTSIVLIGSGPDGTTVSQPARLFGPGMSSTDLRNLSSPESEEYYHV